MTTLVRHCFSCFLVLMVVGLLVGGPAQSASEPFGDQASRALISEFEEILQVEATIDRNLKRDKPLCRDLELIYQKGPTAVQALDGLLQMLQVSPQLGSQDLTEFKALNHSILMRGMAMQLDEINAKLRVLRGQPSNNLSTQRETLSRYVDTVLRDRLDFYVSQLMLWSGLDDMGLSSDKVEAARSKLREMLRQPVRREAVPVAKNLAEHGHFSMSRARKHLEEYIEVHLASSFLMTDLKWSQGDVRASLMGRQHDLLGPGKRVQPGDPVDLSRRVNRIDDETARLSGKFRVMTSPNALRPEQHFETLIQTRSLVLAQQLADRQVSTLDVPGGLSQKLKNIAETFSQRDSRRYHLDFAGPALTTYYSEIAKLLADNWRKELEAGRLAFSINRDCVDEVPLIPIPPADPDVIPMPSPQDPPAEEERPDPGEQSEERDRPDLEADAILGEWTFDEEWEERKRFGVGKSYPRGINFETAECWEGWDYLDAPCYKSTITKLHEEASPRRIKAGKPFFWVVYKGKTQLDDGSTRLNYTAHGYLQKRPYYRSEERWDHATDIRIRLYPDRDMFEYNTARGTVRWHY